MKMSLRKLLLISSSRVDGYKYLEVAKDEITDLLTSSNVKTVLFIPYASDKYDSYFDLVNPVFKEMGFKIESIHHHEDPVHAVNKSEAIFIGGGNTFLLLKTLCDKKLIEPIKKNVIEKGKPYIGSSAGTNVATPSINTTNDMPIVYPPTFDGLNLIPFNINPHYIETDKDSKHKGETRDERIEQFLEVTNAKQILGLREGSMLRVIGSKALLKGVMGAKLFTKNNHLELEVNSDVSKLFESD